jgi:hypothetical protein
MTKKVYENDQHGFNCCPEHDAACQASSFFTACVGLLVVNASESQKFKCYRTIQRKISFSFWPSGATEVLCSLLKKLAVVQIYHQFVRANELANNR